MAVGFFMGLAFEVIANLKRRIFQLEQDLARTIKSFNNAQSSQNQAVQSPELESDKIVETTLFSEQFSAVTAVSVDPSIVDTPTPLNPLQCQAVAKCHQIKSQQIGTMP